MASDIAASVPSSKRSKRKKIDEWEARDAMHTLMRAQEIIGNKPLLKAARGAAVEHARKSADVARQATQLAKMGRISPKAAAKHLGGNAGSTKLNKTAPLA